MKPVLNQLAKQHAGNLKVVQIDVMDNPAIANKYDINAVAFFDFGQWQGGWSFSGRNLKGQPGNHAKATFKIDSPPPEQSSAADG